MQKNKECKNLDIKKYEVIFVDVELKENERIDDLEFKGLKIIQNEKGFCFGMDSVLLSDFAKNMKNNSTVLDLGTGTGIIPILLCGKTNLKKVVGIEIQQDVANMAKRSSQLNNLQDRFEVVNTNIIDLKNIYEKQSFDVIVTNPPYKKENTGITNENEAKLISRHEITANLEDFISISKDLLKDKGEFYMVHRPERLVDILSLMRKYKIEPKILKFVSPNKNKEPNLILIKGIKNANSFLKVEKNLYVYNEDGKYTNEILKIYNK
ncbi:MAG: tRNA1(Val) (adenine(37)-N6)-methyltransferase [Clostridiales bacterium]|nr:tRNA1(Val) (adenine(37)-N6)-methyltransferase [Clostridiales bacterium]